MLCCILDLLLPLNGPAIFLPRLALCIPKDLSSNSSLKVNQQSKGRSSAWSLCLPQLRDIKDQMNGCFS